MLNGCSCRTIRWTFKGDDYWPGIAIRFFVDNQVLLYVVVLLLLLDVVDVCRSTDT